MAASPLPIGWWTFGRPVHWPAHGAAAAGVVEEGERGLGHSQGVAHPEAYGGRIGCCPQGPTPAQLGPLAGEPRTVDGREPHPPASGLRQCDPVDDSFLTQPGQPPPRLLDPHPGRDHRVHLLGGGHPHWASTASRSPPPTSTPIIEVCLLPAGYQ